MEPETILSTLLELAQDAGLSVRSMPSSIDEQAHRGGSLVRLKGKEIFFLNSSAETAEQVQALAAALAGRKQLADRFLPPEIRQIIGE